MTTPQKLGLAQLAVINTLHHHQSAYCNGMSLRAIYAERKQQLYSLLAQGGEPEPLNIANSSLRIYTHILANDSFRIEFPAIESALKISEASDAFKEAFAVVQPLVDKVRELEAQLASELEEHGVKLAALREAEEIATAKAQALLEKDPTVQKLRADIAASKPAHLEAAHPMPRLIRGRIELPATA